MEILDWKISSCRAKIIGTIVSMIGAFVVVLYKGPMLLNPSQKLHLLHLQSLNSDWLLGGFLFSVQYLSYSFWYILMTKAIKMMGADTVVIFLYYTCTTLLSTPICFLLEKDLKAWTLPTETALWAILYSGLIGQSFMMIIHAWALGKKGPVYVSSFRPLTIIIAATLTFILLGDPLYFGSVIGAIVISIGFYALLWGKAKEIEIEEQSVVGNFESTSSYNEGTCPLLQSNPSKSV